MDNIKGPICYNNWKAYIDGKPWSFAYEVPLFTDSHITGEIVDGYGPYQFLNTVPIHKPDVAPSIILRLTNHIATEDIVKSEMDRTNAKHYHGGKLQDEIAALLSLNLGVRFKAGDSTRTFQVDGDSKGHPCNYIWGENPTLKLSYQGTILPYTKKIECLINNALLLKKLPELNANDAVTLVKAARLYQDAIWIAESEPALSWLLFVSAIETAADQWHREKNTPAERLKIFDLDLFNILESFGGEKLIDAVAEKISNVIGATKKFVDFLIEFIPSPPENRPEPFIQHDWQINNFQVSFKKIYGWRSRALHNGISFPAPMCNVPMRSNNSFFAEKPPGLAMMTKGATWMAEDTPMLLHLFEYIVRNALIKWWKTLLPN